MRKSSPERTDKAATPRVVAVTRTRAPGLALVLAFCLLLTACPPEGGDLLPMAGGEGAALVKTRFEGDTLSISRGGVTLKARGRWSVADGATSVILEAANANAESVTIDFARCEMAGDGGERWALRSVSDETANAGPAFLSERAVGVGGGQERRFALEFKINDEGGRGGVPRNVLGRTATLRVPVEVKSGPPARFDFAFSFKFAESRQ